MNQLSQTKRTYDHINILFMAGKRSLATNKHIWQINCTTKHSCEGFTQKWVILYLYLLMHNVYNLKRMVSQLWQSNTADTDVYSWGQHDDERRTLLYSFGKYVKVLFDNLLLSQSIMKQLADSKLPVKSIKNKLNIG